MDWGYSMRIFTFLKSKKYKVELRIWRKSELKRNNVIEKQDIISNYRNIKLGQSIYIGPQSYIMALGGVEIGSNVRIGPRLFIWTENHDWHSDEFLPYGYKNILKKVIIHDNVWIGSCATLCPGSEIGEGAIVGMGAVVRGKIPPCAIVTGNPSQIVGYRDKSIYEELKRDGKFIKRNMPNY